MLHEFGTFFYVNFFQTYQYFCYICRVNARVKTIKVTAYKKIVLKSDEPIKSFYILVSLN